jgi:RNA polymerase sigma-70 factor, ECF subfamily
LAEKPDFLHRINSNKLNPAGKSDDQSLFESIKSDSKDAFTELFRRYYSSLCYFTELLISDRSVAEEIVQDLFVTLWQKKDKIVITTSLKSYLYMSVKNRAINHIRKFRTIHLSDQIRELCICDETPDDVLQTKELSSTIREAVDSLPNQARKVFTLRYFNNEKQKDVARIMNLSESTVEKHMMNALRHMRRMLIAQRVK